MVKKNLFPGGIAALLAGLVFAGIVFPVQGARVQAYAVSYLSGTTVYLDGGREEGLAVGDRLQLVRSGETIAEIEVAFVADHSASCRIVSELRTIQPGDLGWILSRSPRAEEPPPPPPPAPVVEEEIPVFSPLPTARHAPRVTTPPWAKPSGSFSMRMEQSQEGSTGARGLDELTGRLNLRLRELGGRPLDFRVRMRSRQNNRDGAASARSDRLYELSLMYAPEAGRFSLQLGRIGASPFVSIGYLDGALAQVLLGKGFYFGGFYGARPVIEELGFDSDGTKYGAFLRYSSQPNESRRYAEVVLAGVGEYEKGGLVNREYVALESRLGVGSRWSLFQRAELDLARQWDGTTAGQDSQLSALSLSGFYRFSDRSRASVTYDQRRNFRTAETRDIPEDFFDNLLREGLRVGLHFGRPQGWQTSTTLGVRRQEGGEDPTYSLGLSLFNNRFAGRRLLVGADVSVYSGGAAEGYLVTLRGRKILGHGHEVGLTLGTSSATLTLVQSERVNHWLRLSSFLQLPRRFFLIGEIESNFGDDLEGQRFSLELGYRF